MIQLPRIMIIIFLDLYYISWHSFWSRWQKHNIDQLKKNNANQTNQGFAWIWDLKAIKLWPDLPSCLSSALFLFISWLLSLHLASFHMRWKMYSVDMREKKKENIKTYSCKNTSNERRRMSTKHNCRPILGLWLASMFRVNHFQGSGKNKGWI